MNAQDPYRLRLHITPPEGWLNDPNGLCYYNGTYHVYFQYDPDHVDGSGGKCWGHYTSPDLLRWEYQGIFLSPDQDFDRDGVYSGCAFPDENGIHFFYTGNVKEQGDYDYICAGRRASQVRVDSGDGFAAGRKQVLLTNGDYPDACTLHVRDPKVWREENGYGMVLGARIEPEYGGAHKGAALVYRSQDMRAWSYEGMITTRMPFGYMWECPDYLSFGNESFLSVSPQGLLREEYRNQNIYQSGYFKLDGPMAEKGCEIKGEFREWDMGFDFYAPQTFLAPGGRRILIGWMGLPDIDQEYKNPTTLWGWQHGLTLPREITCRDGMLYQQPVKELEALRGEAREIKSGETITTDEEIYEIIIDEIDLRKSRAVDAGDETDSGTFRIWFNQDFILDYRDQVFFMEFRNDTGAGRTIRRARLEELRDVRIIMDTSAVEIYVNCGAMVFTSRYYPKSKAARIKIETEKSRNIFWKLAL